MRYSVWCCVSSDEQAQDKASIPNQLRYCREYGARLGGTETAGPFIADGYSRSYLEGLEEAMEKIPPLREAINAAARNEYDVLICYYFERFGTVAYPVFIRLGRKYKKQLRSVMEQTHVYPPDLYDIARDEATSMMVHMSGIKQDYRINRLVLNRRDSMPRRIQDGLTPGRTPYAYRYISPKVPPEQDPEKVTRWLQARDALLSGESLSNIADILGVTRRRVPTILSNPYYYGQVEFNRTTKIYKDPSNPKQKIVIPTQRAQWVTGKGKHVPIITRDDHDAIVAELARRQEVGKRRPPVFVFAGLLTCGVCNGRARRQWFGSPGRGRWVVTCRQYHSADILFEMDDFTNKVIAAIQDAMRSAAGASAADIDAREQNIQDQLARQGKQRRKIQEGFENDVYNAPEAAKLLKAIDTEGERLQRDLERLEHERQASKTAAATAAEMAGYADNLPILLQRGKPVKVNALLRAWIRTIRLGADGTVKVVKR